MVMIADPTHLVSEPAEMLASWSPRVREHPVPWMQRNIYFDDKHSAVPGYWNWTLFPYGKGVVEAFMDPHVRQIVLSWGTQLGKTTLLTGLCAWLARNDPRPTMIALPNMEMAVWHHDDRLMPMLEACPDIVKGMLPEKKRRRELVDLGTMLIHYGWSGSITKLSGRSIFAMFISEINVWDTSSSVEGDRVQMALDRTKAFPSHKIFYEGKPTIKGQCRLTKLLDDECDEHRYFVPCPHCNHYQVLMRGTPDSPGGLKWDHPQGGDLDPRTVRETAYYQCEACRQRIDDNHKVVMNRNGEWRSVAKRPSRTHKGFYLGSLNSPTITFGEYAERFVRSWRGSHADRQAFVNGWDSLAWETRGEKLSPEAIYEHSEPDMEPGRVRSKTTALVCTCDVQADRIYYRIRGWDDLGSYGVLVGVVEQEVTGINERRVGSDFEQLEQIVTRTYQGPEGSEFRVRLLGIDSRYRRPEVLEFCAKFWRGRDQVVWPIFGEGQYKGGAICRETAIPGYPFKGMTIDKGMSADELMDRVMKIQPGKAGYWMLEGELPSDFAKHMCSHYKAKVKDKAGHEKWLWVAEHEHDHWWDCERYQLAFRDKWGLSQIGVTQQVPQQRQAPMTRSARRVMRAGGGPGGW